jgi:hypothetical protein
VLRPEVPGLAMDDLSLGVSARMCGHNTESTQIPLPQQVYYLLRKYFTRSTMSIWTL